MQTVDPAHVHPRYRNEILGYVRKYKQRIPKCMTDMDMSVVHLPACKRHRLGTDRFELIPPGFAVVWDGDFRSRERGWTCDQALAKRYTMFPRAVQDGKRLAKEMT